MKFVLRKEIKINEVQNKIWYSILLTETGQKQWMEILMYEQN